MVSSDTAKLFSITDGRDHKAIDKSFIRLYNNLTAIDVSNNTAFDGLDVSNNNLTALDVSKPTELIIFNSDQNALTKVNLANGNNDKLTTLDLTNNPNLTCAQVDNPSFIPPAWEGRYDKDRVTFQTEACQ